MFSPTLDYLPGLPSTHKHFGYVTYPRFGPIGKDMFCSFRDGKAGLGDDHLYVYKSDAGRFYYLGILLTGVQSNPYVHGMDYRNGRFHVTWVYRGFVHYEGWDDPADVKHKQQAGPNGAENNHNICYAYSDDCGSTWRNSRGDFVASLTDGNTIRNDSPGIVVFDIAKGHGLTNQESQVIDQHGGVHILNRDTTDGKLFWRHYYRSPADGVWSQRAIGLVPGDKRGRLAVSGEGDLYIILPDATTSTMRVVKASRHSDYSTYEGVWMGHGLSGEPLVDIPRLEHDNILSILVRANVEADLQRKAVVVLDFVL